MPARLRVVQRSLAHSLDKSGVLYCPSCGIWRRALSTRPSASSTSIGKLPSVRRTPLQIASPSARSFRPFTSSSFITAGKTVPPQFRELYDALSGLQDAAIEQVSITRLQLALRGLESEAPLIRVAGECLDLLLTTSLVFSPVSLLWIGIDRVLYDLVLGLDNADSARKLVRLLLADPLSPRESWEDTLEGYESDPSQGLLIR